MANIFPRHKPLHRNVSRVSESSPHDTLASPRNIDLHSIYCHGAASAHGYRMVFVAGVLFGLSTPKGTSDSRDRSERDPGSPRTQVRKWGNTI